MADEVMASAAAAPAATGTGAMTREGFGLSSTSESTQLCTADHRITPLVQTETSRVMLQSHALLSSSDDRGGMASLLHQSMSAALPMECGMERKVKASQQQQLQSTDEQVAAEEE